MVGGSPNARTQPPDFARVLATLDAIQELRDLLDIDSEKCQALRAAIARHEEVAARARVGEDLEAARAEAGQVLSDAKEKARQIEIEAAKARAQAEQVLSSAQRSKQAGDDEIKAAREALKLYEQRLNAKEFDLNERKKKLDAQDRDAIVKANQNKMEEDRLKAWRAKLEAASRP